ncbi:MAG TPA: hypothetical protein VLW85_13720, partial [Myxococcales bacterium]|nr:hypothetical protein [Myxococcales bacterium]
MRTLLIVALLLPALGARAQQDPKEYNYYGDDQDQPPQVQRPTPPQVTRPVQQPVAMPPQPQAYPPQ